MPHPFLTGIATPTVIAHRGFVSAELASQGVIENSRAAVKAALDIGADIIETDCRLTRDGTVVLFHDADLARSLGDERAIDEIDVDELETLMADRGGLLTLQDALSDYPNARFNIDIKVDAAVIPAGQLVAGHGDRVLITSFSDSRRERAIAVATQRGVARPATSAGMSVMAKLLVLLTLRSNKRAAALLGEIDALQIPEYQGRIPVLSERLLTVAHEAGVAVHVWTVNDACNMKRLVDMGVDGIVTDRADLALAILSELRKP